MEAKSRHKAVIQVPVSAAAGRQAAVPIRIAGGIVQASSDSDSTAAIGDGAYYDGTGTSITITGGIVTASGRYGIGRGNTSEPYPPAYQGEFSMTGNAVIFTKGITDTSEQDQWNGIVFFSTSGQVYGDSVTLDTDFTIPEGYTLTIPSDGTLCVGDGVTITNDGSIENYGTIQSQGDGTIANRPVNHRMILEVLNPDRAGCGGAACLWTGGNLKGNRNQLAG